MKGSLSHNHLIEGYQRRALKGNFVVFADDDGPGLKEPDLSKASQVGARLDESTPCFGLPITRELAELYGGSRPLVRDAELDGNFRLSDGCRLL